MGYELSWRSRWRGRERTTTGTGRELYHAVDVGRGKAGRGVQAGGRRPEVSASRQLAKRGSERAKRASERADRQAGKKSARVVRVSYRGYARAVVGVGACSRPAAAFSRCPFSPRRGAARRPAAALPLVGTVPARPSDPRHRATGAAATHHPSDSVGRADTTPPACWAGGEREPAGPQL